MLLAPLLGMQTASGPTGMTAGVPFRAGAVVVAALVFAGRLLLLSLRTVRRGAALRGAAAALAEIGRRASPRRSCWLAVAGLVFAIVLPFLPFSNRYLIDIGTTVLIYVMLGWGLNIVVGLAGLLDLGYVAFYAVGAYSFALFAAISVSASGTCCRSPACSPPASASCSAFRYCGCAATTWRSSLSASARSSASCC